ncbi:MAG: RDD family protein [Flavipsychrobacter sp.]
MEKPYEPVTNSFEQEGNPAYFVQFAGFWARFFAVFIDGLILFIPVLVLKYLIDGNFFGNNTITSSLVSIVIRWLYFAIQESSSKQATFGKQLLDIKVTDEYGKRIGFGRATGRFFGKILSAIILLIGFIMAGFTARKQALHDMLANTLVVSQNSFKNRVE